MSVRPFCVRAALPQANRQRHFLFAAASFAYAVSGFAIFPQTSLSQTVPRQGRTGSTIEPANNRQELLSETTPLSEPSHTPLPEPSNTPTIIPHGRVTIVIDPGHGGRDPGAIGIGDLREIDVILPISLRVAEILKTQGIDVRMTRDSDYFVGLEERVAFSRQVGAQLFVSIHANSIGNRPDVSGLEVYHNDRGGTFADTVFQSIVNYYNERNIPIPSRFTRQARFLVLRKSEVPAILVETGYLSSPEESVRLADPNYREAMANGIAKGILSYLPIANLATTVRAN
jgi:N-acetylmuramoyl-L-alanine amidase